ncbi:putative assembly chaperone of rpl4 [Micractinium conductrix]|uniref:Assembly chaperone of rpl4 n=1 Tax=Micractinium conductrix TaxID=554055 RepID=A0A2P6VQZ3_9CHLO|nr:putative assembly chaperone of rpl4 [Micractinium conductrix]|eukprot:PSC76490.1 putative assembly chaperone of rpl4 [Micractinium conductrix]
MAFAMDNFDLARASFKRALDAEPENLEFLEGYGSFLAETGAQAEAATVLRRAVQLQPEEGFEKYMYLGQLVDDSAEAEQHVRKGIAILRSYMQQQAAEPQPAEGTDEAEEAADARDHLQATLCSCLVSLAEVLLTKGQHGAEGVAPVAAECEQLLGEARELSAASPEPLQALASLRQQQGKDEEALALLRQSLALWFKPSVDSDDEEAEEEEGEEGGKAAGKKPAAAAAAAAKAEGSGSEEEEEGEEEMELEDDSDVEELPSYEFRFETAKLLLELDESVDTASQVLEQLLEENDTDPNVWLLLALCCQGGGDLEGALECAEEGMKLCKLLQLPSDNEMVTGFESMQSELQAMMEGEKKAAKAAGKADGKKR